MKTKVNLIALLTVIISLFCQQVIAQETPSESNTQYVVVTKRLWNMDMENPDREVWMAMEKEYHDKVVEKNELIKGSAVYMHRFTPDSREVIFVQVFSNWKDIMEVEKRTNELIEEAWPDKSKREDFFKKLDNHYSKLHRDEIYTMMPGAKFMTEIPTEEKILYVQVHHTASPEGGSTEEFDELSKTYNEAISKNEYVKAYYPHTHLWGSDSTEFIEAFLIDSLDDMKKFNERHEELMKELIPSEETRNSIREKGNKYLTGVHEDYIYTMIPQLSKLAIVSMK